MNGKHALGKAGEEAALAYLRGKKFKILCRGFRYQRGEIDIIARDGDTLVFIEVKTRRRWEHGLPEEAVTPSKQRQIRRVAGGFLALNNIQGLPCRFDVLSLYVDEKNRCRVRHIPNAFE